MGVIIISEAKHTNRLIKEKSPYLLQHAHNPVDWYSWSDEAFARAKAEDKPVFLSIGYSTCHWCHVMERESFEDEEAAELLNRHFVAIKVDREERPDIDHIYMTVCQGMTGHGGWPLTIVMTPAKKPFFAGTYFPKTSRGGMKGMMELLPLLAQLWDEHREELEDSGDKGSKWLQEISEEDKEKQAVTDKTFADAFAYYKRNFDDEYGGFGPAPKFPSPHNLMFLLRYYYYTGEPRALEMVEKTLVKMYQGGMYDHIGFGFARYSTDQRWLVPHFEKMLYDNALLVICYLEAYQITGRPLYARVARETIAYILRDMTAEQGGFYSAEDADSAGVEGRFYVWSRQEVLDILGRERGELFCDLYDITAQGNFEGENIPNLIKSSGDEKSRAEVENDRLVLFSRREERVHPHKDDKILSGWNGLMIWALARAYAVLDDPLYLQAARRAVAFIMKNMRREDGRLLARYREGEALYPAYAADYSFLINALLELYQASFDSNYLAMAVELNEDMIKYFWDETNGGLYFYGMDGEELLVRPKEAYDGAVPSANSVAALNFMQLGRLTGSIEWEDRANELINLFGQSINQQPAGYGFFLMGALFASRPSREIVITGEKDSAATGQMLQLVQKAFLPDTIVVFKAAGGESGADSLASYIREMAVKRDETTAYVCENYMCRQPVTDPEELRRMIVRDKLEKIDD